MLHVPSRADKVENPGRVYNHPGSAVAPPLRCPACAAPFWFTSSLTAHQMTAHARPLWTAILFTLAGEQGGGHVG